MRALIASALVVLFAPAAAADSSIAAFAFGRGKAGARTAVDVQRTLRELVPTTGPYHHVDMLKTLHPGQVPPRMDALEEGRVLLEEGKAAYEQLDLEAVVAEPRDERLGELDPQPVADPVGQLRVGRPGEDHDLPHAASVATGPAPG